MNDGFSLKLSALLKYVKKMIKCNKKRASLGSFLRFSADEYGYLGAFSNHDQPYEAFG